MSLYRLDKKILNSTQLNIFDAEVQKWSLKLDACKIGLSNYYTLLYDTDIVSISYRFRICSITRVTGHVTYVYVYNWRFFWSFVSSVVAFIAENTPRFVSINCGELTDVSGLFSEFAARITVLKWVMRSDKLTKTTTESDYCYWLTDYECKI